MPTYPSLTREFFENLRVGTGSFDSTVKGVLIVINESRLGQYLEMPWARTCIPKLTNKSEGLKCILEREDVCEIKRLLANQLPIKMHLLHHMVSKIFFPKIKRFDCITERDITVMYYMIQDAPINLPHMMMGQI